METKTSLSVCVALCMFLLSLPKSDGCLFDHDPPTLKDGTCRSSMTVRVDRSQTGKNVQWTEPEADDACRPVSIDREDTCQRNGGYFTVSDSPYHIKYSATDRCGNKRKTLCSFTITVKE
ncbi:uncharacterized protein LOC110975892 [Acanthaster planci]|uniref:Uncharacterized protein LOC110975892 n=1 Tax=Acanthaster planci TaxID=133434 RepID=A0A8B7XUC1_ACAPL|nr:uncharacterized protein LOC110975892 [Acanthaster planci]